MELLAAGICLMACIILFVWHQRFKEAIKQQGNYIQQAPQVNVNFKPLQDSIDSLPGKVLQSIVSSTNSYKGALGELIGYVQLHAAYDRIIPLGNIVDFICIRFKTDSDEGCIDFVDVKTGDRARLSGDQRELQRLVKEKKINFVKLKVQTTSNDGITE